MSALVEFSMTPLDKGESVGEYVARSLKIIDDSGLPYRLNAMGTVVEAGASPPGVRARPEPPAQDHGCQHRFGVTSLSAP